VEAPVTAGTGRLARVAALALGALAGGGTAAAQTENVPPVAKAFVVQVVSYFEGRQAPELGAGTLFGVTGDTLHIATAAHVVQKDTVARRILVTFSAGDAVEATVAHPREGDLDLAVLSVVVPAARRAAVLPVAWDRLGDVRMLRGDDPVYPVGCPNARCWEAPTPADRVVGKDRLGILFQSSFVATGSSGGALFNGWWEVVGLVIKHEPARANAISIDDVVRTLEGWHYRVSLRRASVPRPGYRTTVGAVVMTSTSSSGASYDARAPSGRVTVVRQISPALSWHVGGLRLAPENLAITAGMAGLDLHLSSGRFALHPFVEAGFGHVEGRYDLGGFYVAASGGSQYVPLWNRVIGDGLGVGGGTSLEVVVWPPGIVELTVGYWSFTRPLNAPKLNQVFVGAGVRLGL
jgi:trypsin-like peptidase